MKYIKFHDYVAMVMPWQLSTPIGHPSRLFTPFCVMHDAALPMNIWSIGKTTDRFYICIGPVIASWLRPDFVWRTWRGHPTIFEQALLEEFER